VNVGPRNTSQVERLVGPQERSDRSSAEEHMDEQGTNKDKKECSQVGPGGKNRGILSIVRGGKGANSTVDAHRETKVSKNSERLQSP